MKSQALAAALLVFGGMSVPVPLLAQAIQTTTAQERIDPASIEALRRMGVHLASLTSFEFSADTQMEVVLDSDQKLAIGGRAFYQARRPDRLRVDLITDVVHRELFYDGKSVAFVSPDNNVYARFDAPATIKEMLETAAEKYSLAFPAADLFAWGTNDAPLDKLREGFLVGHANIEGVLTDHWAFRGEDQDWEVWIAADGPPLPLKVSVVDRDDMARPRFTAVLRWNEQAVLGNDVFTFSPPEGMALIGIASEDGGGQ